MTSALRRTKPGVPSQRLRHARRRPVMGPARPARHIRCFGEPGPGFPVSRTYANDDIETEREDMV